MLLNKKIVSVLALVALVFSSGLVPILSANAAGITSASDTVSSSDLSVVATHTVAFTTSQDHAASDYFEVVLSGSFGTVLNATLVTCPSNYTAQVIGAPSRQIRCLADSPVASGTKSIIIRGATNASSVGSYLVTIGSYASGGALKELTNVQVAMVQSVVMSAAVTSNLVFGVAPVASGTSINGITTNGTSSTSTIPFGSLTAGVKKMIGQELTVTTNATNGYTVTVEQNQDLLAGGGAKIDPFIDGTASTTAQAWVGPTASLGSLNTYGHMGFTSSDTSLAGGAFGADSWKGFTGTTPAEVMYNNGPADGTAANIGKVQVAYSVQISALQEAGDYTNTLIYICTPRF